MVNKPNPVPPHQPSHSTPETGKTKHSGSFHFKEARDFLGMHFEAEDWSKFMDVMLKNLSESMNNTMAKSREQLKLDWKRGMGEDV